LTYRTDMNTFLFLVTALSLAAGAVAAGAEDARGLAERVHRVLAAHPIIDGHNDLPWAVRTKTAGLGDIGAYDLRGTTPGDTDLERLRAGGVGGQFWSVYVPGEVGRGFARLQLEQIDLALRIVARYPDRLALATTAAEVDTVLDILPGIVARLRRLAAR